MDVDADDEFDESHDRFILDAEQQAAVRRLAAFVESLIVPRKLSAATIQALARLLLVLRRIPQTTYGVYGSIGISIRQNGELRYFTISIGENTLELSDGGSVYDPGVGSDSYSSTRFTLRAGEESQSGAWAIDDWIEEAHYLLSDGAKITFDIINDTDDIEWEEHVTEER